MIMLLGHSNDLLKSRFKRGRCSLCGVYTLRLELHHIKYRPEITIGLCHKCHFRVHYRKQTLRDCDLVKLLCRICKPETMIKYAGRYRELFNLSLPHSLSRDKRGSENENVDIAPSRQAFFATAKAFKDKEKANLKAG